MIDPGELSTPALALYTELRDTGELLPWDEFSKGFPEADYDEALMELKNKNMYPEPAPALRKETGKVRFVRRSEIPMRFN